MNMPGRWQPLRWLVPTKRVVLQRDPVAAAAAVALVAVASAAAAAAQFLALCWLATTACGARGHPGGIIYVRDRRLKIGYRLVLLGARLLLLGRRLEILVPFWCTRPQRT